MNPKAEIAKYTMILAENKQISTDEFETIIRILQRTVDYPEVPKASTNLKDENKARQGRFREIMPDLISGSWEDVWERVRARNIALEKVVSNLNNRIPKPLRQEIEFLLTGGKTT